MDDPSFRFYGGVLPLEGVWIIWPRQRVLRRGIAATFVGHDGSGGTVERVETLGGLPREAT